MDLNRLMPLFRMAVMMMLLAAVVAGSTGCRSKTPEERYQEATQLVQENQIPLAVLKLKDLIAQEPESPVIPEARILLSGIYIRLGREENIDQAIEQLQTVIDELGFTDQRAWDAHQAIIELNLRKENFEAALAQADKAVEMTEGDPETQRDMRNLRATLLLASQDEEAQKEGFEFFANQMMEEEAPAPLRHQSREIMARYHRERGSSDEVLQVYADYMEAYPNDPVNPMLKMAQALEMKRQDPESEEAEELYAEATEERMAAIEEELDLRRRAQMLNELATMHGAFGKVDEAEALLRRIMSEQPVSQDALDAQFAIARLYLTNRMLDEAEEIFAQISTENPNTNVSQAAEQYLQAIDRERQRMMDMAASGADATTTETETQEANMSSPPEEMPGQEMPEAEPLEAPAVE